MVNENQLPPFTHGLRLGVKVSLALVGAYAVLGTLFEFVDQIRMFPGVGIMSLPIARFAGLVPVGLLMVVAPAIILGTLTGGVIGELWEHFGWRVGKGVFATLGLGLCTLMVVGLHIIFDVQVDLTIPSVFPEPTGWISDSLGFLTSYPFLLGIPSIIYILAGAWGSFYFWRLRRTTV